MRGVLAPFAGQSPRRKGLKAQAHTASGTLSAERIVAPTVNRLYLSALVAACVIHPSKRELSRIASRLLQAAAQFEGVTLQLAVNSPRPRHATCTEPSETAAASVSLEASSGLIFCQPASYSTLSRPHRRQAAFVLCRTTDVK